MDGLSEQVWTKLANSNDLINLLLAPYLRNSIDYDVPPLTRGKVSQYVLVLPHHWIALYQIEIIHLVFSLWQKPYDLLRLREWLDWLQNVAMEHQAVGVDNLLARIFWVLAQAEQVPAFMVVDPHVL